MQEPLMLGTFQKSVEKLQLGLVESVKSLGNMATPEWLVLLDFLDSIESPLDDQPDVLFHKV